VLEDVVIGLLRISTGADAGDLLRLVGKFRPG
jgi:hypothetical protein